MDRVGALVVFLLLLLAGAGVALHQHNKAATAQSLADLHAKSLADQAAHRTAILESPQRLADLAACARSLPESKCAELFAALDCYHGRWECPDACDAASYRPDQDPELANRVW